MHICYLSILSPKNEIYIFLNVPIYVHRESCVQSAGLLNQTTIFPEPEASEVRAET